MGKEVESGPFLTAAEIGTGGAGTLPGACYTSPEHFRRERERIFRRRWLCAGREERLAEPGDYLLRNVEPDSVLIVRGDDGELRAFHNVCRHRGTRLCNEAAGRFSGAIRCPYHRWTYALDGRLKAAPSMSGVAGFDPIDYPLHPVPLARWEGLLFIHLGDAPEPFATSHAPVLHRFARFRLPALRSTRRIEYDVRANWKLLFENYSECYHCGVVHPTLARLSPANSGSNDLVAGPFLGGPMDVAAGCESLTLSGRSCAIPVADLPPEDLRRVYYYALFPNLFLSLHAEYAMVHTLWPVAPDRTLVECEWLFHPEAPRHDGFNPDDAVDLWDRTNREDWRICELSQLGVASPAYTPGPYSPRESLCAEFDRVALAALADDPPG